jgi:hypothetical protein
VPDRRSIFRLLALAGFLLTVALALWLAEVRPLLVIIVMALALGVAWSVEWLSWRQEVPREVAVEPEAASAEPEAVESVTVLPPEPAALPAPVAAAEPPPPAPVELAPVPEPEPEPEPVVEVPPVPAVATPPPEAAPEPPPAPEPEPVPEPVAAPPPPPPPPPAPEPEPAPRPPLRPVPPPPPEPAPPPPLQPAAAPVRPAASSDVVDLRMRATIQPRRWNLWDLERRARDEQARDPLRYEEWSYLFVHLRQFATPDGSLPTEFDGLVRESFGELLEHAG